MCRPGHRDGCEGQSGKISEVGDSKQDRQMSQDRHRDGQSILGTRKKGREIF